jgi:hypothetical protein
MSTFTNPAETFMEPQTEPRTSIMAVLSFVSSLICCVPILSVFFGLFGAFLGVVSLMLIGGSNGRLKGRGFAFAGVVLGLLTSMLWIGLLLGGVRYLGGTVNTGTATFEAIDAGKIDESRSAMMPVLDQAVSDEQIVAFGQMVRDDYGGFVSGPKTFMEFFSGMSALGKSGTAPGFQAGDMPVPLEYENGPVLAYMAMPDGTSQPAPGTIIRDLGYQRPDGTIVWLSEVEAVTAGPDASGDANTSGDPDESGAGGDGGGGD